MEELKPSNSKILEQLRHGFARFELVSTSTCSVSDSLSSTSLSTTQGNSYLFFAHTYNSDRFRKAKKVEFFTKVTTKDEVTQDSRSLFQALAKGMAFNNGDPKQEKPSADELRKAVKEAICNEPIEEKTYKEALLAITLEDEPLATRYCERIGGHDFLGGRSELLVLSKRYKQPIIVYKHEQENGKEGYIQIAEFGAEFCNIWAKLRRKKKNVVRLVFSNHGYDLLQ